MKPEELSCQLREGRAKTHPWLPLALAAKVGMDALQAGRLTMKQITKEKALCLWCLLASACTFASVPAVIPEAQAAQRRLKTRAA